ncbi:MAG: class I SAM-dependent methyltransferase [Bacteriovoracia bacterium]
MAKETLFFVGQPPDAALLAHDESLMFPVYQKNFSRWLPSTHSARILDFGCGYGTFLRYLRKREFSDCRGFDPDSRCAAFAQAQSGAPVSGDEDPFLFLARQHDCFDFVACLTVAVYFERERMLDWFSALRKTLKPGGTLLLTVPNAAGFCGLTDYVQDPFMKSFFTDVALRDLCRLSGFEIEHLGSVELPRKGIKRGIWQLARKAWFFCVRVIYLLERGASERNPRVFDTALLLVAKRPHAS